MVMNCNIPDGLPNVLQAFVVAVMSEGQGDTVDIYEFGLRYFQDKLEQRKLSIAKDASSSAIQRGHLRIPHLRAHFSGSGPLFMNSSSSFSSSSLSSSSSSSSSLQSCRKADPECLAICRRPVLQEKSLELRHSIRSDIRGIPLFRFLDDGQRCRVVDAVGTRAVDAGDTVIEEGDRGERFYAVRSGVFAAYSKKSRETVLRVYDEAGSFGELALMYDMPRAATVIAKTAGSLWTLDRATFRREVLHAAMEKRLRYEPVLRGVKFMAALSRYERSKVADALGSATFRDGAVVVRQYEPADCMFFVESGEFRICVKKNNSKEVEIARKFAGDYFGELGLMADDKLRAATVYSVGACRCGTLDLVWFDRLLERCRRVLQRNVDAYDNQLLDLFGDVKSKFIEDFAKM